MRYVIRRTTLVLLMTLLCACHPGDTEGSGGGTSSASSSTGAPAECATNLDCDDGDPCTSNGCISRACHIEQLPAGSWCGGNQPNPYHAECDSVGACVWPSCADTAEPTGLQGTSCDCDAQCCGLKCADGTCSAPCPATP